MSNVTHPSHYNSGKIEVIEAIEDWGLGFHLGNAVKYIARAGKKDPTKEVEDLEKSIWYVKRQIENLKAAREGRSPIRPNDMNPRDEKTKGSISATHASVSGPSENRPGCVKSVRQDKYTVPRGSYDTDDDLTQEQIDEIVRCGDDHFNKKDDEKL